MTNRSSFNKNTLAIDSEKIIAKVCTFIQDQASYLKRDGVVIGLSGGIDSSLCANLCVKALGKEKVVGLILPERESNPVSASYAMRQAQLLGIKTETIDITTAIDALGAYTRRDDAIRKFFPDYRSNYRAKLILPQNLLSRDSFNFYTIIVDYGSGNTKSARLDNQSLRKIVSATNLKQRTRMVYLYSFAEENNQMVCGTTNRSETMQGFFVKYGDGGVDIEPIAGLYKTQVYQLARYLELPKEIIDRTPSPDTFGLEVSDEEFYFRMPYGILDMILYAWENKVDIEQVCNVMDLTEDQVKRAFRDVTAKYNITRHLRALPPSPELLIS